MGDAKVLGNPISVPGSVPDAPVPSQVGVALPEPPAPISKDGKEVEVEEVVSPVESIMDGVMDKEMDAEPKGTITISVFENSPYEIDFVGIITGTEIDLAWRAMMKEYRVWKHTMFRKLEQEKKDGGV